MTISRESQPVEISPRLLADPVHLLALGFGAGLAPKAPGTFGSMVGLIFAILLAPLGLALNLGITLVVALAGFWICDVSARRLGVHDHPAIVWDEVAGMMITMLAAPPTWMGAVGAFALFRIFDIAKPWPIRAIDHGLGGGVGIMLDDVVAGILAAIVLLLIRSVV